MASRRASHSLHSLSETASNAEPSCRQASQLTCPPNQSSTVAPSPTPTSPYTVFTHLQKHVIITIASIAATFSGFASNIYFPAIPIMAASLHTSVEKINLTVTSYMVFQAISPTFWGAISDVYGRRITLICTLVVFTMACIGLALTQHLYQLIILRCMQSAGSASTIAIGAGTICDVTTREERGGYMGVFQAGLLLPLAIGPVLGGVFAETLGWRAIFWFLVIYSGVFLIVLTLFQPETLRSLVGNGSTAPYHLARNPIWSPTSSGLPSDPAARVTNPPLGLRIDFIGPLRILFFPEVFCVLLFLSIHYATWQMALTAQSSLFSATYGLGELGIGLTFLANGFGCILGTLTTGKLLDRDYRRLERKFTGSPTDFPIERARLRTVWLWSPIQWGSVLLFGWTLDKHVHIAAPVVASFTLAWSAMSIQAVITTFIVDIFPKRSASATAALNMARCLMGAGATASVDASIRSIGVGWTFTLWTGLMVISISLVGVQIQWGAEWRKKREENERHAAAEAENQPKS